MITGGYYIKSRKIQESEISLAPPHVREIWDWLLREANHQDNGKIKRGQCVRGLKDMQEGLKWFVGYRKETYSKSKCEMAMNWLRKRGMITTTKTTRGMVITVCNYDLYQDPKNYESNKKRTTKPTRNEQGSDTINKNDNNDKNDNNPDDKSSPDFIQQLILQFQEVYLQSRDLEYVITNKGKERTATSKLLNLYKSKNPQSDTKQTLEDLNKYFHACINISDNWLYENMSLPIIINQFNKINNILRNGKKTKSGANWQEVAGFIARDFG